MLAGISFDQVVERACKQNPFLRYCANKNFDSNMSPSSGSTTSRTVQSKVSLAKISSGLILRDPIPQKDVFRSSTRESSESETAQIDAFCVTDEARYKHYCQDTIDRAAGIEQELYKYCIDYESRCPQMTVDKKINATEPEWDKPAAANTMSGTEGFIEEQGSVAETSDSDAPNTEEIHQYCEKYEPNFLYFCVGDNNDDAKNDQARIGRFCEAYAHDCPEKIKKISANFPAKSIKTTPDSTNTEKSNTDVTDDEKNDVDESEIEDYCNEYSKNYHYFCTQHNKADDMEMIDKFCKAYKNVCQHRKSSKGDRKEGTDGSNIEGNSDNEPPNPFEAFVSKSSKPDEVFSTFKHPKKLAELAKPHHHRVPCTIECDPKKHPHCTPECKCDLIYPVVQKFCNPPPLPIFLQTCRMWYTFCPKYKQYHYASQFIHSKSQKGKVSPGQAIPVGSLPVRDIPIPFVGGLLGRVIRGARNREVRAIRQSHELPTFRDFTESENYNRPQERPFKFSVDELAPSQRIPHTAQLSPNQRLRIYQATTKEGDIHDFDKYTDAGGRVKNQLLSRSPWTKPGLWEANPSNPHNRDHANKFSYNPDSVTVDWLNGQVYWGAHWAVPAASVGGTNGYASVHFPSLGPFFGIEDDYD